MRSIFALIIFCIVFFAMGIGTHYMIFQTAGIFVWSKNEKSGFGRTMLKKEGPQLVRPHVEPEPLVEAETLEGQAPSLDPAAELEAERVAQHPTPPTDPSTIKLFNGRELGHWRITQYGGEGDITVNNSSEIEFEFGELLTGLNWKAEPPQKSNYEISLEAMRLDGNDFFCALTFPVKESHASFIVGGWGGGIVGISSVDDLDASVNETLSIEGFDDDVWYKIRVKVTNAKIEAWIDDRKMVDLDLKGRKISLRPGDIELSTPIGITSFQTRAKYRNIIWQNLPQ